MPAPSLPALSGVEPSFVEGPRCSRARWARTRPPVPPSLEPSPRDAPNPCLRRNGAIAERADLAWQGRAAARPHAPCRSQCKTAPFFYVKEQPRLQCSCYAGEYLNAIYLSTRKSQKDKPSRTPSCSHGALSPCWLRPCPWTCSCEHPWPRLSPVRCPSGEGTPPPCLATAFVAPLSGGVNSILCRFLAHRQAGKHLGESITIIVFDSCPRSRERPSGSGRILAIPFMAQRGMKIELATPG